MTTRALYCEASAPLAKLPTEATRLVRLSLEGPGGELARVTLNPAERAALAAWLLSPAGGSVWVAEHLTLGTRVAVKFISVELAKSQPELKERFLREAAASAKIASPHVARTAAPRRRRTDGMGMELPMMARCASTAPAPSRRARRMPGACHVSAPDRMGVRGSSRRSEHALDWWARTLGTCRKLAAVSCAEAARS